MATRTTLFGVAALAREVGLSAPTVSKHMKAGRSADEIRRLARARQAALGGGPIGNGTRIILPGYTLTGLKKTGKPGPTQPQPTASAAPASSYMPTRTIPKPGEGHGKRAATPIRTAPAAPNLTAAAADTDDPDASAYSYEDAIADRDQAEQLNSARLRRAIALADEKELQNARARGELVPLEHMRVWGTRFLTQAKEMLLKGPGELQDHLAGESNPGACNALVRGWVERVLGELYNLEGLWQGGAGDAESTKVA